MGKKLLIVESPAKAKTIGKYLGGEFIVASSVGHVRDLPEDDGAIKITETAPGKWKFVPKYVISKNKTKVVSHLKDAVSKSDEIFLASDPDREGEAIAWHLREVLKNAAAGKPFHRVTYNEITKPAVLKAVSNPGEIDMPRVDAQQARRILDRLVGYKVSPLLWKSIPCKNSRTLSAGRVQSVALRLLVERQREIDAFVPQVYYLLGVEAMKRGDSQTFEAKLARIGGEKPDIGDKKTADGIIADLEGAELSVSGLKSQQKTRHALPPFTTSTLQQAASSVLGFSPGKTMKAAQALYEQGLITYMRTDSVFISDIARSAAKDYIVSAFGPGFYPEKPNMYKSKETAQGAHEAIRPTNVSAAPGSVQLEAAEAKLYDLIWRRFVSSQMSDAKLTVRTVCLEPRKTGISRSYEFTASATDVDFEGFLRVMKISLSKKKGDDEDDQDSDEVKRIPPLSVGETLDAVRWISSEKTTKGPSYYSEASLVKALEENGVGRPSTYAATIETLKTREYARNDKRKLVPEERGILVSDWLVKKLDNLFNVGYTAEMEAELDKVEEKGLGMDDMLSSFYGTFLKELASCSEPMPDKSKFETAFALLESVREWKEPVKAGKRVYDDRAFVESVRKQFYAGKSLSVRQLDSLVRMVGAYRGQIPDAGEKLKAAGMELPAARENKTVDTELASFCVSVAKRIPSLSSNAFVKSIIGQFDRGRQLSERQLAVLARTVSENGSGLPDYGEISARLAPLLPDGATAQRPADPSLAALLVSMAGEISKWREPVKRGKRTYDDAAFVKSVADQFASRHNLSERQVSALKRVVSAYKDQISNYSERMKGVEGDKSRV